MAEYYVIYKDMCDKHVRSVGPFHCYTTAVDYLQKEAQMLKGFEVLKSQSHTVMIVKQEG